MHYVHSPVFIIVDLCINIFERQLSSLFGTKILPPPPLLKLQKAFRGLIDGGIEVERRGGNSERESVGVTKGTTEAFTNQMF